MRLNGRTSFSLGVTYFAAMLRSSALPPLAETSIRVYVKNIISEYKRSLDRGKALLIDLTKFNEWQAARHKPKKARPITSPQAFVVMRWRFADRFLKLAVFILINCGLRPCDLQEVSGDSMQAGLTEETSSFKIRVVVGKNRRSQGHATTLELTHEHLLIPMSQAILEEIHEAARVAYPFAPFGSGEINDFLFDVCAYHEWAPMTSYSFRNAFMLRTKEMARDDATGQVDVSVWLRFTLHKKAASAEAYYGWDKDEIIR